MGYTGYKIIQYIDENPNSSGYGEIWTERVLDTTHCPSDAGEWVLLTSECEYTTSGCTGYKLNTYYNSVTDSYSSVTEYDGTCTADTSEEIWVDDGEPYCEEIDGIYTGYMIQEQVQRNSALITYGQIRQVKTESSACTEHMQPEWQTISTTCHVAVDFANCSLYYDGTADIVQIDNNPSSPTFNQTRTINEEDEDCICEHCDEVDYIWVYLDDICGVSMPENYGLSGLTDTTLYHVYKKYQRCIIDGQPSPKMNPINEYSAVTYQEYSEECSCDEYRWTATTGYVCSGGNKVTKEIKQYSCDSGATWHDVLPEQSRAALPVIESASTECGYRERWVDIPITDDYICDECPNLEYRWIATTGYVCSGTNKMKKEIKQVSYDSGSTWQNVVPEESRAALPVIEYDSTDCGYIPPEPQYRTITSYTCSGYDKYVVSEYQVSYNSGETWNTVSSSTSVEYNSEDCGYIPPSPYASQYFTTIPKSSGTFRLINTSSYYSLDDGATWTLLPGNTDTPTFTAGQKIMWKSFSRAQLEEKVFSASTSFDVEGNVMSLLYGDNFVGQYDLGNNTRIFARLFQESGVVSAENLVLPATTLSNYCYEYMFYGCASLVTVPKLPATTLAERCYQNMFQYCASLTTAPELPATTLAIGCYKSMFYGCTNLNYIKCLATDKSASSCTSYWVYGVQTNSGTFVKAASMTSWTTGANGIPTNWTVQDNS